MGGGGLICPRLSLCVKMTRVCVCVCVHDYKSCYYCNSGVWTRVTHALLHQSAHTKKKKTHQRADICIFRLSRAMWANECVTLTWWPVRWRRAAFPAGRADSLHSSSGVGASLHRSCHSSGTCRRRARRRASEWRTAGQPPHIPGSRSRSRWPGVGGGAMGRKIGWRSRREKYVGGKNGKRRQTWPQEMMKGESRWNNKWRGCRVIERK